jgi:hypothetical protein
VQKDPFLIFLSDLSKKIALEKEHKQIMEKIDSSETVESVSESPLEGFISTLKEKLTNTVSEPIIVNEEITKQESVEDIIKRDLEGVIIETTEEKENPFTSFVNRLKDIIEKGPTTETTSTSSAPVKSEQQQIPVINSTEVEKKDKSLEPTNPNEYVNELEKIKNSIAIEKEDEKVVEIKKLIEEYAEKYIKKAVGMIGESGGGTNAVQYANGGTMNGDLNVNGNYLSGGVNLLDIFSGGGGGSGDPAVNALVHANSGQWNEAYSNLVSNSAAYLSGYDISFIIAASGNWENTYTTVSNNSGYWSEAYSNLATNSANYLSGFDVGFITSNFVHLSGDTMTGGLSAPALSADAVTAGIYYGVAGTTDGINTGGQGGSIDLRGGDGFTSGTGGAGGTIEMRGVPGYRAGKIYLNAGYDTDAYGQPTGYGGRGGDINLSGNGINYDGGNGGDITMTGSRSNAGSINTSGGWAYSEGGSINTSGDQNIAFHGGGSINTSGGSQGAGGYINISNGGGSINTHNNGGAISTNSGGYINTSVGGGSIDTRDKGKVEFGHDTTRTTLTGSATQNRTVYLPDGTGTLLLSSPYIAFTNQNTTFEQNVTIQGNLTALGTSTFANTVFTTTSALSVVNLGPGPALYVFQAAGPSDIASFYDGDGVEVLHVGNAQGGGNPLGKVGINTSFPSTELTVNGAISSNRVITVLEGNSNQWNSNYSTTQSNSANWSSVYTSFSTNSGKYDSNWTTTNSNSGKWDSNWTTVNSNSANWILDGGNTKGANISIGTNDNYNLALEINNNSKLLLTSDTLSGNSNKTSFGAGSATGTYSFAVGSSKAFGDYSHAVGQNNTASGVNSHAEGAVNTASGGISHVEGYGNIASGGYSHAEGAGNTASGDYSHAEGLGNIASGEKSHAEGVYNTSSGYQSHAEGNGNVAAGIATHAEGQSNIAAEYYTHAEGSYNVAVGSSSHVEGYNNIVGKAVPIISYDPNTRTLEFAPDNKRYINFSPGQSFPYSINGYSTEYRGIAIVESHAYGSSTIVLTTDPFGEYCYYGFIYSRYDTSTSTNLGLFSHAEGYYNTALGSYGAHVEGTNNVASGQSSHAEGSNNVASGTSSHAEGLATRAAGYTSHAAGGYAIAAHDRTWIWKGSTLNDTISTTRTDQFLVSAAGGIFLPGNVGIGTDNNTNALTVVGTISTNRHKTSLDWASNWSTTNSNSANWSSVYTSFSTNSGKYDSNWTTTNSNSGKWDSNWTTTNTNSAAWSNWPSVSGNYALGSQYVKLSGDNMTGVLTNSVGISSYSLSARYIDLVHVPANDGLNPVLRIGEFTPGSTTLSGFSGMFMSYNESSNTFGISAQFAPAGGIAAVSIDRDGKVGIGTDTPTAKLTIAGTISGNNLTTSFGAGSATGTYSFAVGNSKAFGSYSHAEGIGNIALGSGSHAEGTVNITSGDYSHTEGYGNIASGSYGTHAEGYNNTASGNASHAEGYSNTALGFASHAEGVSNTAFGDYSHAEGEGNYAMGVESHVEGNSNVTGKAVQILYYDPDSRTFEISSEYVKYLNNFYVGARLFYLINGYSNIYRGSATVASHSYNSTTIVLTTDPIGEYCNFGFIYSNYDSTQGFLGYYSHAEGYGNTASGNNSHAEGTTNTASGYSSHAEGYSNTASGYNSHAEGANNITSGDYSHAEGYGNIASGYFSHAEGNGSTASGTASHAEGSSKASGQYAHAEGANTRARGNMSHAAGSYAEAAHDRTWVWKGSTVSDVLSTTRTDQFLVSAAGGIFFSGNVGIGTDNNANALTVVGTISTNRHKTSQDWASNWTTTNSNSSRWESVYTSFNSNSGKYDSNWTTVNTNSGKWDSNWTTVNSNSAAWSNWQSVSGNYALGSQYVKLSGDNMTGVLTNSAGISAVSLSARFIDLIHIPANDGANPVLRIGEFTPGSTTLSGFSGMFMSYNEVSNTFGISAQFAPAGGIAAVSIDRNGRVGIGTDNPTATLSINGTISGNNLTTSFGAGSATGTYSFAVGNSKAFGDYSHAEGVSNIALGQSSHAEGWGNTASGNYGAHAEGYNNVASNFASHAEGNSNISSSNASHAEGSSNIASGAYSHAEGNNTRAFGYGTHTEGYGTVASGNWSHAENDNNTAGGDGSHVEGTGNVTATRIPFLSYDPSTRTFTFDPIYNGQLVNYYSGSTISFFAQGYSTTYRNVAIVESHAYGSPTIVITTDPIGEYCNYGEVYQLYTGQYAHAEGGNNTASGDFSHAEGQNNTASGYYSHAEGVGNTASLPGSHAEGGYNIASGYYSHAEGLGTNASGYYSHAEGSNTRARGNSSHAAGRYSEAAHDRTWVWQGSTNTNYVSSTRTDQFMVSAAGGVYIPGNVGIGTDNNANALTVVGTISSASTIVGNNVSTQNRVQYLSSGLVKVYQYYNTSTNSLDTVFS